jgi:hypothetical protein
VEEFRQARGKAKKILVSYPRIILDTDILITRWA